MIFRADSIQNAFRLINCIVCLDFGKMNADIVSGFNLPELLFLNKKLHILEVYPHFFLTGFLIVAFLLVLGCENAYEKMKKFTPTIPKLLFTVILLVWCVFPFSGVRTFLYFNF